MCLAPGHDLPVGEAVQGHQIVLAARRKVTPIRRPRAAEQPAVVALRTNGKVSIVQRTAPQGWIADGWSSASRQLHKSSAGTRVSCKLCPMLMADMKTSDRAKGPPMANCSIETKRRSGGPG